MISHELGFGCGRVGLALDPPALGSCVNRQSAPPSLPCARVMSLLFGPALACAGVSSWQPLRTFLVAMHHSQKQNSTTEGFGACGTTDLEHSISGLVVEYIVAIDVTRVRFPADACLLLS